VRLGGPLWSPEGGEGLLWPSMGAQATGTRATQSPRLRPSRPSPRHSTALAPTDHPARQATSTILLESMPLRSPKRRGGGACAALCSYSAIINFGNEVSMNIEFGVKRDYRRNVCISLIIPSRSNSRGMQGQLDVNKDRAYIAEETISNIFSYRPILLSR
jgi:hypothetical protein